MQRQMSLRIGKMTLQQFIDNYLEKHKKQLDMPFGMAYYIKLNTLIEKAEKLYKNRKQYEQNN